MAYGAGLATGLLHFGAPRWVVGISLILGLCGRRSFPSVLCAALALGRLSGEVAWIQEGRSCAARLPPGPLRLSLRLLEPAGPDRSLLEVQPLRASCTGVVSARWPQGRSSQAGLTFEVGARWVARPGRSGRPSGTLVIVQVYRITGKPALSARLRTALSGASRTLYGTRAPMVDALILGRRGGMDRALQDRFAQ
ncbi:MAG TPA: hypothetical protein VK535_10385, partial [Gemmatimonadales bacterium]|nr:hypothetical protein [Gemmatimonadales bacterium]